MKKIIALLMVAVMAFGFCACGGDEDDANKLVIGYTIYEPMNYMENGELTGFDTEFAKAVCKKIGLTPEFKEINWDTKFQILDSEQIDCIWNGMTISPDVKKNCAVSTPYVKNAQVVVMAKDALEKYPDAESMKDLRFTAEAGSAGEAAIKDNGLNGKYKEVATQVEALTAIKAGQADACVIDITMAKTMTEKGTSYENLGYAVELTSEEYGIGFRTSDIELNDKVNKAIEELRADGTLDKLAKKYGLTLADLPEEVK